MHRNCINLVMTVLSEIRMNFFANRVNNAWNNLPTSVSFTSLPTFSKTIRSVDFREKKLNVIVANLKDNR